MRTLIDFLFDHQNQLLIYAIVSGLSILITFLAYWVTNRNRIMKYLPAIILIVVSLYELYVGLNTITEESGVNSIMIFGLTFVAGFVGFCYALILGILNKNKKVKTTR